MRYVNGLCKHGKNFHLGESDVFFFLSPTLAIKGVHLSVVGWQYERQKINRLANWCTNRELAIDGLSSSATKQH